MTLEQIKSLPHIAKIEVVRLIRIEIEEGWWICHIDEESVSGTKLLWLAPNADDTYPDFSILSDAEYNTKIEEQSNKEIND